MPVQRIASVDSGRASPPRPQFLFLVRVFSAAGLLAIAVGVLANFGRWLAATIASPVRGDVLVALGGGDDYHVSTVVQLNSAGHAPAVLVTGLESSTERARGYYVNWYVQVLAGAGRPIERLRVERAATNSFQKALATLDLMLLGCWETARGVSDPLQMRLLDWVRGRCSPAPACAND